MPDSAARRNRLPVILTSVVLLAAVTGVGLYAYQQHRRYRHVGVHVSGQVYRCGWAEADVIAELVQKNRIKTVINLCRPGEMGPTRAADERKAVEAAGATLLEWPMANNDDPEDPQMANYMRLLRDPATYPLLVHCQHGVNRTARLLSMYDVMYRNLDGEDAIRQMPRYGRHDYAKLEYDFARNFTKWYHDQQAAAATAKANSTTATR